MSDKPKLSEWNNCKIDAVVAHFKEAAGQEKEKIFRESITAKVRKNPTHKVSDMANQTFEELMSSENYKATGTGIVQDINFSARAPFENGLSIAIESCASKRGK